MNVHDDAEVTLDADGCTDCRGRSMDENERIFWALLPGLLRDHEGRHVLIANGQVQQITDTFTEAARAGNTGGFGRDFLVEQIKADIGVKTALILG